MNLNNNSALTKGCLLCQGPTYIDAEVYRRCDMELEGNPCLPCAQMKKLETEITETKARLQTMLAEHREMRAAINRAHDSIVRRVPWEITALIFQHVVPDAEWTFYGLSWAGTGGVKAPLRLAAVCKVWREIAFHTPRLWTSIRLWIDVESDSKKASAINSTKLDLFCQWVSRTGQLPLSVDLQASVDDFDFDRPMDLDSGGEDIEISRKKLHEDNFGPFFDVLNISDRLRDLEIHCPKKFLQRFTGCSSGMQNLRCLSLYPDGPGIPIDVDPAVKFSTMAGLPQPQVLLLHNIPFTSTKADWSNLTQLFYKNCCVDECLEVPNQCPRLTHCDFRRVFRSWGTRKLFPPLNHTSLQFLRIFIYECDLMDIMNRFAFPSLYSLTLHMNDLYLSCNGLLSLMKRSSCALKYLRMVTIKPFCQIFGCSII